MDLSYSPDEQAFRNEVRRWLAANLPDDIRQKVTGYQGLSKDDYIRWHKILASKGWSVPHWPEEWGGTGWNITQRYIYDEEFGLAGAPMLPPWRNASSPSRRAASSSWCRTPRTSTAACPTSPMRARRAPSRP